MKKEKQKRRERQLVRSIFLIPATTGVLFAVMLIFSYVSYSFKVMAAIEISKGELPEENKVYEKWLKKNESKADIQNIMPGESNEESYKKTDRFLVADLNNDGTSELIVNHPVNWRWDNIYVYTYDKKKEKITQVKGKNGEKGEFAVIEANTQAMGSHSIYICKKNHLHVCCEGGYINQDISGWYIEEIYTIKKGKLRQYAKKSGEWDAEGNEANCVYELKGEKTTAKKYTSFRKKCGSDKEAEDYVYPIWNTKENREKYLK